MSGTLPPPPMRARIDIEVDELLASTANLTEKPFDIDEGWDDSTREYDARAFAYLPPEVTSDDRSTLQMLGDAKVGLDLFLNEASVALMVGHRDLTDFQRGHLTKIVTFVQALSDRFDRVMQRK